MHDGISLNVFFGSGSVNVLQSADVNPEEASSDKFYYHTGDFHLWDFVEV